LKVLLTLLSLFLGPLFALPDFVFYLLFALLHLVLHPLAHLVLDRLPAGRDAGKADDDGREHNYEFFSHASPSRVADAPRRGMPHHRAV
jgi:hypothetical protein